MVASFHNIIIRMPNWLGDAIMAIPIIIDVRANWPDSSLTVMCQEKIGPLFFNHSSVDQIFTFSSPNQFLRRQAHRNLIDRIRQGKYDLGILLPNSFSSAWYFWKGGVRERIGFASDWRSCLLTQALPFPKDRKKQHLVATYKKLIQSLHIPISETKPALFLSDQEKEQAQQRLIRHGIPQESILIGVNPGAAYGTAKCWLPENFRKVIQMLVQRPDTYVICFADQAGADLVHEICSEASSKVINLAGKTDLRDLIALIAQCDVFLTNDSGPMHIAAALNIPVVALFGSTNEMVTGPYTSHARIIHKHVACSPCYQRVCPIDLRCMKKISVEEVYAAILEQLVEV